MTSRAEEAQKADRGDHMLAAEFKRAAREGKPLPGRYVVEARRTPPDGFEETMAWTEAEWVLAGNPRSKFPYREEAEKVQRQLETEHPQVTSGAYQVRLRIVRRAPDDQGPDPLPAPPPPPPPLTKGPVSIGEKGAPTISDLVRAATGVPTQE